MARWIDYHVGLVVIAALIALIALLGPPCLAGLIAPLGLYHLLWHKKNIAPRRFLLRAI